MSQTAVRLSVYLPIFFIGNLLFWADRTNFSVAAAVWAKQYGWTPAVLGALLSAFSLGSMLMQPFAGWIADRAGPRRTVATASAVWSLWVLLTPFTVTVQPLLIAARALLGISEAPYQPSMVVSVAKAFPEEHRRATPLAIFNSAGYVGPALGVFLAAAIVGATKSAAMVFYIFAVAGFIFAGGWWLYARRHTDPAPSAEAAHTAEGQARAGNAPLPLRALLLNWTLWPLFLGWAAGPYCQFIFLTWLPQYLTKYHNLPVVQAGLLASVPFFAGAVMQFGSGFVLDWFAKRGWTGGWFAAYRKSTVYVGALIFAIAIWIAATTGSTSLAVIMITVGECGLALYGCSFFVIVSDVAPNQAGLVFGLMNFFGALAGFLSPLISGIIAQRTGAFVAPLQVAVGVIVVGAVLTFFLRLRPLGEQSGRSPVPVPT